MVRSGAIHLRLGVTLSSGSPSPSTAHHRLRHSVSSAAGSSQRCRWFGGENDGPVSGSGSAARIPGGSVHLDRPQGNNRYTNTRAYTHAYTYTASFSSTAASSSSSDDGNKSEGAIRGWMNDRQARKEKEKYMEQMTRLSSMDVFTMEKYRDELQRGVDGGGMLTKISFMQTKEIKQAKEVVEFVEKIIEVVGPDATAEDLIQMDRLQRLRVANAANKTLEEIAIMVSQITNMDVMQKTLRKRQLEGKPIPPDKETMQAVIQKDALSVLSKSQKELMRSRQESNARRMARKRRR